MAQSIRQVKNLTILGDSYCLDFANTVGWHASKQPQEWIRNYDALVEWSLYAGIITKSKYQELYDSAVLQPQQGLKIYEEAIEMRECLYRIFSAEAAKKSINLSDLSLLNKWIKRSAAFVVLNKTDNGYYRTFAESEELDQMLWVIADSAAELLTSDIRYKIKQCEGGTCGWLFIDTSKNKSRRWCSMQDCGNREKAKKYYNRRKQQQ
ncbi:CGNR zinc finger domain-containing protein [Peribacillus sp. SCS-155]|uniref:CGNR zinc finger domain-containing protein n=1 Tax=Peribacillus sedimenti TaxID=3115297 RepID=UPI003906BD3A